MAASEGLFDTMAPSTWHRCEGKNVGAVASRARKRLHQPPQEKKKQGRCMKRTGSRGENEIHDQRIAVHFQEGRAVVPALLVVDRSAAPGRSTVVADGRGLAQIGVAHRNVAFLPGQVQAVHAPREAFAAGRLDEGPGCRAAPVTAHASHRIDWRLARSSNLAHRFRVGVGVRVVGLGPSSVRQRPSPGRLLGRARASRGGCSLPGITARSGVAGGLQLQMSDVLGPSRGPLASSAVMSVVAEVRLLWARRHMRLCAAGIGYLRSSSSHIVVGHLVGACLLGLALAQRPVMALRLRRLARGRFQLLAMRLHLRTTAARVGSPTGRFGQVLALHVPPLSPLGLLAILLLPPLRRCDHVLGRVASLLSDLVFASGAPEFRIDASAQGGRLRGRWCVGARVLTIVATTGRRPHRVLAHCLHAPPVFLFLLLFAGRRVLLHLRQVVIDAWAPRPVSKFMRNGVVHAEGRDSLPVGALLVVVEQERRY